MNKNEEEKITIYEINFELLKNITLSFETTDEIGDSGEAWMISYPGGAHNYISTESAAALIQASNNGSLNMVFSTDELVPADTSTLSNDDGES